MAVFQQIVNVLAYVLSILTFMSPIPSLVKAWRGRDLGELSFVPFAAMIVNSFVWLAYGLLSDSIFPLFVTMVCCEVLSIAYVVVYFMLCKEKTRPIKILSIAMGVVALVLVYIALARSGVTNQSNDSSATVVGIIADVGSLVMYAAPFETIVQVIRSKDASSMPIHLCLVGAIGNTVWVIYAILASDIIVLVPNSICSTVGWIQVAVYMVYRPGRHTVADYNKGAVGVSSPVVEMAVTVESPVAYHAAKSPCTAV